MAWDSFTSIKDFGYEFKEGRLVDIESGNGFNFEVSDTHWYNQKNYEMLGEVITEYVYELLQSDEVGLKKLEIPLNKESGFVSSTINKKKNKDSAKGFIFVSEGFHEKEKLLVLVHGSGVVKAGQWARRLIINDCLDHGTQIPYIRKAIKDGYGVVVLNTNQNEALVEVKGKKILKTIKESETPEKHFSYVWKNIIEKTKASKIFAVAHSYGGYLVVNYFMHSSKIMERVVAVAFTDSVHSLSYHSHTDVRKWFLKNSVNWVTSPEDLDTPMVHQDHSEHITRVSAGTTRHEETSWKAMDSVFKYFQNHEFESNNQNEIKKGGKSGGAKKSRFKKEEDLDMDRTNGDNIVKQMNNEKEKSKDIECRSSPGSVESSEENERSEGTKSEGELSNISDVAGEDQPQKVTVTSKDTKDIDTTSPNADEPATLEENMSSEQKERNEGTKSEGEPSSISEGTGEDQLQKVPVISKDTKDIDMTSANADEPAKLAENKSSEQNETNEGTKSEGKPSSISEGTGEDQPQKVTVISKHTGDIGTTSANADDLAKLEENKSSEEKLPGGEPSNISEDTVEDQPQKVTVISKHTGDIGTTSANADDPAKPDANSKTADENQETNYPQLPTESNKNTNDNEANYEPTMPAEHKGAGEKEETYEPQLPAEKNGNANENEALSNNIRDTNKNQNENSSEEQRSEEDSKINEQNETNKDSSETDKVSKESSSKENDGSSSSEEQHVEITKVEKISKKPDEITSADHSSKEDNLDAKPNEVKTKNDTGDNDERSI